MNVFDTLNAFSVDPLRGLEHPQPKRTIKEYQAFQIFARAEPNSKPQEQKQTKIGNKFQYMPAILAVGFSFVGWLLEANQPTVSINFCNFVCLLIFLPLYILCDDNITSPRKGTHSKDIHLIQIDTETAENHFVQAMPRFDSFFEADFMKEKFYNYVKKHYDSYFQQFKDASKTIVLKNGRLTTVNTEFVQEGDIVVLQKGQTLCFDCQMLPVYYCQEFNQLNAESIFSDGCSFGQIEQPVMETRRNESVATKLYDNYLAGGVRAKMSSFADFAAVVPKRRTVIPAETKDMNNLNLSDVFSRAFSDFAFAGYEIESIFNSHAIYWNDIDISRLLTDFLTQNYLDVNDLSCHFDAGAVVQQYMEQNWHTTEYMKDNQLYIQIVLCHGCFAVCTGTVFKTTLLRYLQGDDATAIGVAPRSKLTYSYLQLPGNGQDLDSSTDQLSGLDGFPVTEMHSQAKKSQVFSGKTTKYTFFSHIEALGRYLRMLPATLLLSFLMVFAPHFPRLLIVPQYYQWFSQAFTVQKIHEMLLHGFVPTMCASLSFCLCSLQFAYYVTTLLRPMLKSARLYVKILQKRMMVIPSLGSLESLGFTNAMVVYDSSLLIGKHQLAICALGMNSFGNMRVFNANEAAYQVFKNRLKKPLLVFPTENDKSYWMCFIRLVTALSLYNEEIANILLQKDTTANYDYNIYNPNYNGPNYQPTTGAAMDQKRIINDRRNMTFALAQQLGSFKSAYCLDFSSLVQPSCLLEGNLSVTQIHPLQTKPFLVFNANFPFFYVKRMMIVRCSSCKDILSICKNILTTTSIDSTSSSEQLSQDEQTGYAAFLFMNIGREVQQRQLRQKDLDKLMSIDSECRRKCYHVEHYAVSLLSGQERELNMRELFQEKRFTYVFHISFQAQASKYSSNFIKRFQKEYNGINLFITTKLSVDYCKSLLKAFNLQQYVPRRYYQQLPQEEPVSEENSSFHHENNAIYHAITSKHRRLMKTLSQSTKSDQQLCQMMTSSLSDVEAVKDYILSKNILKKQHILERSPRNARNYREQSSPPASSGSQKKGKRKASVSELNNLLDNAEMMEVDYEDSVSEATLLRLQLENATTETAPKPRRRRKPKAYQQTSLFLVCGVSDSLHFAYLLDQAGLYVSWISDQSGPKYYLSQITDLNAPVKDNFRPDFLIINSESQPLASKTAVDRILEFNRVSICSIRGKYALERLLDACQEIPFYFMTLSPVFLGTIRSRQLVALLPIFLLLSILIIEFISCAMHREDLQFINQMQIRPFFMPPVAVGIILMFSMIYIEILLPLIIWTPPSANAVNALQNKHPNYVGNRAAMLYDFNKLLPQKTSSRALLIFSVIFTFLFVIVIIPAEHFYSTFGYFQDDFISVQLLKLSPFVSLFYCMIFTAFATGALIIANKLPLGRVWGQRLPRSIYFKKAIIFVLLYLFALIFIFVLPTATEKLSLFVLGFQIHWIDNSFLYCVLVSFLLAVFATIGVILEQALFVRIS